VTRAEAVAALEAAGIAGAARDVMRLERVASDAADLARMVRRRAAREPISHLTGRRSFWKHDFAVTPDVLDPRPSPNGPARPGWAPTCPAPR
jgi:release factor glutamine methyltransferase